jgi:hypothetical protein
MPATVVILKLETDFQRHHGSATSDVDLLPWKPPICRCVDKLRIEDT